VMEMASFLRYVDLYLPSEWGRFYVGHSVVLDTSGYWFRAVLGDPAMPIPVPGQY
jgi:hypothetical protein